MEVYKGEQNVPKCHSPTVAPHDLQNKGTLVAVGVTQQF